MTLLVRFTAKTQPDADTGCWLWLGALEKASGYGRLWNDGKTHMAHRVAYELHVAPIPAGAHIDHLCRNRACVNPDHLEPVSPRENVLRGTGRSAQNARKTHCRRGHAFDEANTWIRATGARVCRACQRARVQAWRGVAA